METDWQGMSRQEREVKLMERSRGFMRRQLLETWELGKELRSIRDQTPHGEWLPWLDSIKMPARTANRFLALADGYTRDDLDQFGSVDAALKALSAKRTEVAS